MKQLQEYNSFLTIHIDYLGNMLEYIFNGFADVGLFFHDLWPKVWQVLKWIV